MKKIIPIIIILFLLVGTVIALTIEEEWDYGDNRFKECRLYYGEWRCI